MEISALQNPLVKAAEALKQKKYRQEEKLFLAEGLRTVEDAVDSAEVEKIFYTPVEDARMRNALEAAAARKIKLICVTENVLKKISDTETPQGIIAVCKMRENNLEKLLAQGKMLLVLDRVSDPGNLGTMLRTADAAGSGGIILLKGCTDPYAPKAVRSSMGSLFHVPVVVGAYEEELLKAARDFGYELLVTCLDGADNLYSTELSGRLAFVVGNEANGVSEKILRAADKKVFIPMQGRAESLNAAMAAGIVMFEALRRKIKK